MKYPGSILDLQVQADGRILDVVSGAFATISRASDKYGLVPGSDVMSSVGPDLLLPMPYSGGGYTADIESSRPNYALNSIPSAFTRGKADNAVWSLTGNPTVAYSEGVGLLGSSQHINIKYGTGATQNVNGSVATSKGVFASGQYAAFSAHLKLRVVSQGGPLAPTADVYLTAWDINDVYLGASYLGTNVSGDTGGWVRLTGRTTPLPADTSYVKMTMRAYVYQAGDEVDIDWCCWQIEHNAAAIDCTSYIPTTTNAVSRPNDVVTIPTLGLFPTQGTVAVVAANSPIPSTEYIWSWYYNSSEFMAMYRANGNYGYPYNLYRTGATSYYTSWQQKDTTEFQSIVFPYEVGQPTSMVVNGEAGGSTYNGAIPNAFGPAPAEIGIGRTTTASISLNAPFHRMVWMPTRLSKAEAIVLSNTLLAGVQEGQIGPVSLMYGAMIAGGIGS